MRAVSLLFLLVSEAPDVSPVDRVAASGRVVQIAEPPSERVAPPGPIAPGAPPLIAFRALEAKQRHRFGDLDLVLDDAGH